MSHLGRLESVDLRLAWQTEAGHFTPWLAQAENLKLLGESIGIELDLEATEKQVGPFRADILCKEAGNDHFVLIENQIERTDHTHLGQLLTYAAGQSAVTVVWIASRFTEEHRAALDWLNEVTGEGINFFGLEIELWRIGDSPFAPKFNIVSSPNSFVKRQVASRIAAATPTGDFYRAYWGAFCDFMRPMDGRFKNRNGSSDNWIAWSAGRQPFNYACLVSRPKKRVTARVFLGGAAAKVGFAQLLAHRPAIDSALPGLEWEERPHGVESYISLYLEGADPDNREDWPRQQQWMQGKLIDLERVFGPIISKL